MSDTALDGFGVAFAAGGEVSALFSVRALLNEGLGLTGRAAIAVLLTNAVEPLLKSPTIAMLLASCLNFMYALIGKRIAGFNVPSFVSATTNFEA